ncbi:site-specific integrase [Streptomyces sp. NPDC047046]|uniref:site-specific integrase n=1 Tax=Streptomyces sp. NPDC047046 TaxID=3155378 RepID=UPI0033DAFC64
MKLKRGTVSRHCICVNPGTGKRWGASCPKLTSNRRHGVWRVAQVLDPAQDGTVRRFRRSGFESSAKAEAELDKVWALLRIPEEDDDWGRQQVSDALAKCSRDRSPLPDYEATQKRVKVGQPVVQETTVAEWLDSWLAGKRKLKRGGAKRYETDVRVHLKPHLGNIRLDRLRVHHVTAMFIAINETNLEILEQNAERRAFAAELKATPNKGPENRAKRRALRFQLADMPGFRRVTNPSTQEHIRATLRAALNVAIAQQIMPAFNPAEHVELETAQSAKALIWTDERVAEWMRTGEKPSPVMVWTPAQAATFLDSISHHRLYLLFRIITYRGLRRGEGCGLRDVDYSPASATLTIATQLVQDGWDFYEDTPKTDGSIRTVDIDKETNTGLQEHLRRREAEREAWGEGWQDTGHLFTEEDGNMLHPGRFSDLFDRLVRAAGLPPIRLHDLRHVAATLMLAVHDDIKVVSTILGHTSTRITRDIYQSVLTELGRDSAEKVAAFVPHTRPAQNAKSPTPATTPPANVTPIAGKRFAQKRSA